MSEHRLWFFLKIVRRKHVILRRDEGLEETPSAARDQAQALPVRDRERIVNGFSRLPANPSRNGRRQQPKTQEWRRDRPGIRLGPCDKNYGGGGESDTAGHLPIEPDKAELRA